MMSVIVFMVLGGLSVVRQDIPGLWVNPYLGDGAPDCLSADLDGDGLQDLLLPEYALMQREGLLSLAVSWDVREDAEIDVWERDVFLRFYNRLEIRRWDAGQWRVLTSEPMPDTAQWPTRSYPDAPRDGSTAPKSSRVRMDAPFLHDLDNDRVPEILLTTENGILVYTRRGDHYAKAGVLTVYPQQKEPVPHLAVDDSSTTRLQLQYPRPFPFEVTVQGQEVVVSMVDGLSEPRVHRRARYALEKNDGIWLARLIGPTTSQVLPAGLEPNVLNDDDMLDLAGFSASEGSFISGWPLPEMTLTVSTDAGKTTQSFQGQIFNPELIDLDGDGRKDVVTHRSGLLRGGSREMLVRALTDPNVDHEILAWRQDASARFAQAPESLWKGRVRFEKPPRYFEFRFSQYGNGDLMRFGDVNADGKMDLAVYDTPTRISVFLQSGQVFDTKPAVQVNVPFSEAMFVLKDIDGDGRDDVVCMRTAGFLGKGRTFENDTCVYFIRGNAP